MVPAALTGSALAAAPAGRPAAPRRHPGDRPGLPLGRRLPARRQRAGRRAEQRPGAAGPAVAAAPRSSGVVPDVHNDGGEGGLMGVAVSPDVRAATAGCTSSSPPRATTASSGSGTSTGGCRARRSRSSPASRAARRHNGGGLWFTQHPSLFATTGDTPTARSPRARQSLAGKVLRMKPDGARAARQPVRQPRSTPTGTATSRASPSTADGRIWASELGENTWDELNRILPGRNYGWPRVEGSDGAGGYRDPLVQWHTDDCSPSGVTTLGGRAWVGALRGECLWSVDIERSRRCARKHPLLPRDLRPDPQRQAGARRVAVARPPATAAAPTRCLRVASC